MNFKKYSIVCIIGLCFALFGCGGAPEASSVNCAGKGLESSLADLKDDEAARQAFLDQCDALKK
ncbi:MAG: entry exclusion lipoprotein TrbK [Nitrosomonas sp.]|uniref:entry exclusion lipoprotein TrbK n=1 Tax=Nitrosomonas sp. TaxID=42353 RepID=UPI0025D3C8B3|nr:entry exclusion lipoprotein TrbK [Nitrosomonas sp.]MBY0474869.1 entry exclusion lipoprotein TrbK [Nitrosomonas sp.]